MSDYDDVLGVADSRGKLIKSLEESIELFKYLQKIVKSNPDLKNRFDESINSITKSVQTVKSMDKKYFTELVNDMYKNNHNANFK